MFRKILKLLFKNKRKVEEQAKRIKELEEEVDYLNTTIIARDRATAKANEVITKQFNLIKSLCFGNKCDTKEFDRLSKIENVADQNIYGLKQFKKLQEEKRTIERFLKNQ